MIDSLLRGIILSVLPVSELRGGIPTAFLGGTDIFLAFIVCVIANILIIPVVFFFLKFINHALLKVKWYEKIFTRTIERSRKKINDNVDKYGYLGLMIFVAIPLPVTGAYTGTLGAWAMGLDWKKSFLFISLGVIIAGIIVSLVTFYGIGPLSIFIKK